MIFMCYNDYLKEVVKLPIFHYDFETDGPLLGGPCSSIEDGFCGFLNDSQVAPCINCPLDIEDLVPELLLGIIF